MNTESITVITISKSMNSESLTKSILIVSHPVFGTSSRCNFPRDRCQFIDLWLLQPIVVITCLIIYSSDLTEKEKNMKVVYITSSIK